MIWLGFALWTVCVFCLGMVIAHGLLEYNRNKKKVYVNRIVRQRL